MAVYDGEVFVLGHRPGHRQFLLGKPTDIGGKARQERVVAAGHQVALVADPRGKGHANAGFGVGR